MLHMLSGRPGNHQGGDICEDVGRRLDEVAHEFREPERRDNLIHT